MINKNSRIKYEIKGYRKTLKVYEDKVIIAPDRGMLSSFFVASNDVVFTYEVLDTVDYSLSEKQSTLTFYEEGEKTAATIAKAVRSASPFYTSGSLSLQELDQIGKYLKPNVFISIEVDKIEEIKEAKDFIKSHLNKNKNKNEINVLNYGVADEIRKFKQLLDDGIINQSEFDEKKRQLLFPNNFTTSNIIKIIQDKEEKAISQSDAEYESKDAEEELRLNSENLSKKNSDLGEQAKSYLNKLLKNGYKLEETIIKNNLLLWVFQVKSNGARFEINSIEELRNLANNFK